MINPDLTITSYLGINEYLFEFEISACSDAIQRGIGTKATLDRLDELLSMKNDPKMMAIIRSQRWGSNAIPAKNDVAD